MGTKWKVWKWCSLSMTLHCLTFHCKGQKLEKSSWKSFWAFFMSVLNNMNHPRLLEEAEIAVMKMPGELNMHAHMVRQHMVASEATVGSFLFFFCLFFLACVCLTQNCHWRSFFGMSAAGKANRHYLLPRQLLSSLLPSVRSSVDDDVSPWASQAPSKTYYFITRLNAWYLSFQLSKMKSYQTKTSSRTLWKHEYQFRGNHFP